MALQVTRNSVIQASAGPSDQILYWNHVPFSHDPAGTWKRYDAVTNAWLPAADPQTGPTAVPGVPLSLAMGAIGASSASVTFAPPNTGGAVDFGGYVTQFKRNVDSVWTNGQIVQRITPGRGSITFAGNTWEVRTDARIYQNGTLDAITANVLELMLINGQFWQQNNANNWYWKLLPGDNWTGPITTSPLASPGPQVTNALVATTPYNFRVHAFNSVGAGVDTAPVNGTTTAPATSFATQGTSIRDPSGNLWTAKFVGLWEGYGNPAWFSPMRDGLSWRNAIDAIKGLGFNGLRIGFSIPACLNPSSTPLLSSMTGGNNSDLAGKNVMEFIDMAMDYCGSIGGMYILADLHNTGGGQSTAFTSDGNFNPTRGAGGTNVDSGWNKDGYTDIDYINAWRACATRWAGKPAFFGCDLMNEPSAAQASWMGGTGKISFKSLYERAGNAIHGTILAINPNYPLPLIVCQPGDYGNPQTLATGDWSAMNENPMVLNNANKIVYAPHIYPQPWMQSPSWPDSGDAVVDWWNVTWGYFVAQNLVPIMLTEWGGIRTSYFTNATAFWTTIVSYMMGTYVRTTLPSGATAPTKRCHWSVWDYAQNSNDPTGIIENGKMIHPGLTLIADSGARAGLNTLIAAAPT